MALSAQILRGEQNIQPLNSSSASYLNITAPPSFDFSGFRSKHSFAVYNEIVDRLMYRITEAEFKALCYIVRRTCGFNKTADAISFTQFTDGLRKRDGVWLDHGTGLSKPSICKALNGLHEKGIIWVEKQMGYSGGQQATIYGLVYEESLELKAEESILQQKQYSNVEYCLPRVDENEENISEKNYPVRNVTGGSKNGVLELVKNVTPQYDMKQNLDKQYINNMPRVAISEISDFDEKENANTEKNVLLAEVCDNLKSFGLENQTILSLVDQYEPEYLLEKIRLVQQRLRRENLSNPTGFLVRAIKDNYKQAQSEPTTVGGTFVAAQALLSRLHTNDTEQEEEALSSTTAKQVQRIGSGSDISLTVKTTPTNKKEPSIETVILDEVELYENLARQLNGPLGKPELIEHLQAAHFKLTRYNEGYILHIHLKESWRTRFFSQSGLKTVELALGRYFGVSCHVQLVTHP